MAKTIINLQKESGDILTIAPVEVLTKMAFAREEINRCEEALNINANCYENGEFIFKDFTTNEQREQQRINQIETKCNQVIEAVYPIYKQLNITNLLTPYTEEDRDVMKAFIDNKRAICHKAIDDGTKAEDVDYSNES